MSIPEQEPSPELASVNSAVWELKLAQAEVLVSPMTWKSEDEQYGYLAKPLEINDEEPVDLASLPDMPLWRLVEVLNAWELIRVSRPDINNEIAIDRYFVAAGVPLLHTSHLVPEEAAEESDMSKSVEILNKSHDFQFESGLSAADPKDYEALSAAIKDLKITASDVTRANNERLLNMTEEERRWERMRRYEWLIGPETDRTGEPRWWGISEGNLLWAVFSATPEEAVVMIEDKRDGIPMAPLFFVDEYPEDVQTLLLEKLTDEDDKVVRLIPFSTEPWPEDPENMTEEQKAAFERLKRG